MSLLGDLADRLIGPLLEKLRAALGPFGKLFDIFGRIYHSIVDVFPNTIKLADSIKSEVTAWRKFKEDIRAIRTGVINIPIAVKQTQALFDQLVAAWRAILDAISEIKSQVLRPGVGLEDPATEAEGVIQDVESGGVKGLLDRFPRLAKGLEKALAMLAIVANALESLGKLVNDLQTIVDAIAGLREEIETGSTVFLQQKNLRKRVALKAGGSMSVRVGALH